MSWTLRAVNQLRPEDGMPPPQPASTSPSGRDASEKDAPLTVLVTGQPPGLTGDVLHRPFLQKLICSLLNQLRTFVLPMHQANVESEGEVVNRQGCAISSNTAFLYPHLHHIHQRVVGVENISDPDIILVHGLGTRTKVA